MLVSLPPLGDQLAAARLVAPRRMEARVTQNAQHSSKSSLWMTPEPILESVRELFGGTIDLDAASDEEANRRVGARQYLTDALGADPWPTVTSCFLNPPGGKGLPKQFWHKLLREVRECRVGHAIYLAFSLEQLQTIEGMLQYPLCIPRRRLMFVPREGKAGNPTHANAIVYVSGCREATARFLHIFSKHGTCR